MMKRLLLSTLLGVISVAAIAQTAPDASVRVPGYQIELPAKPFRMFPGDFDAYKGAYDLSNGDFMVLRSVGRRMYAHVGYRPPTELIAASRNEFVAVDRQLKMTLSEGGYGDVTGELVMVVPRQTAQAGATDIEVVKLLTSR
jgi:hypothetical protein